MVLSADRSPSEPDALYAFPCTFDKGRSITGTAVGSYSCFCSRANMLLFLTRDAFCSLSIEDLLVGDGDDSLPNMFSELNRPGVAGSRPCQNRCGDAVLTEVLKGDDWNGEESMLRLIFCRMC